MVTPLYCVSQRNMLDPIVRNQTETCAPKTVVEMGRNTDSRDAILSRSFGYPGAFVRSA